MNRIDRLTATLIQLQTKRVVRAEEIAGRFGISLRTVYRDVRALMEAGVPIGSEPGKGYFIVDGYHLPPVMFNRQEASALLTAAKLVEKLTDGSIRDAYASALLKIKSVLNNAEKDHLETLQSSIAVFRKDEHQPDFPNAFMADIQQALSGRKVLDITYVAMGTQAQTRRAVEPIGIVFYSGRWHLIGWCRLRLDYRDFRTDMIQTLRATDEEFDPRNHFTLQEYFNSLTRQHGDMEKAVIVFDRSVIPYARNIRYYYGYVSEEDLGDRCRMTFLVESMPSLCKWLMMYGSAVEVEGPPALRDTMRALVDELSEHYAVKSGGSCLVDG